MRICHFARLASFLLFFGVCGDLLRSLRLLLLLSSLGRSGVLSLDLSLAKWRSLDLSRDLDLSLESYACLPLAFSRLRLLLLLLSLQQHALAECIVASKS